MRGGEGDCCVVVVGAGAAGALTASHLVTSLSPRYRVTLVDPAPTTGRGPAYSTTDERHLLNVPASGMSAFPRDPEHFFRWVRNHHDPRGTATGLHPAGGLRRLRAEPAADGHGVSRQRPPRAAPRSRRRHRTTRRPIPGAPLLGTVDRRACRGARDGATPEPTGPRRASRTPTCWWTTPGPRTSRTGTCSWSAPG